MMFINDITLLEDRIQRFVAISLETRLRMKSPLPHSGSIILTCRQTATKCVARRSANQARYSNSETVFPVEIGMENKSRPCQAYENDYFEFRRQPLYLHLSFSRLLHEGAGAPPPTPAPSLLRCSSMILRQCHAEQRDKVIPSGNFKKHTFELIYTPRFRRLVTEKYGLQ